MAAVHFATAVKLEDRVKSTVSTKSTVKVPSKDEPEYLTTGYGSRIADKLNALTVGPKGPVLLQDAVYLDEMAHFVRERIPPRVVHAKGAGAFGYFQVTHDITEYTRAKVFTPGTKTDVAVRFSLPGGEQGGADTSRDLRGFAMKFYTEEGNWDLVGNNSPIFLIRDPLLFLSLIHSQKRNPVTNLKDLDTFWDFLSLRPESTHQVLWLFADRGIPDGYRHMHGYGSHTFKLVNAQNEGIYCKFHFKTDQGIKNLTSEEAYKVTADDPDYSTRDLYDAIEAGQYPSWTLYIQVMTFDQATESSFNPFDITKVWPHKLYPLKEVGKLCLNKNPENYFSDVEQLAFSPSSMVPGIEPSPDKLLQGRLFPYPDTHRYRIGTNFLQIPVNCPYKTVVKNYQRDGSMRGKQGGAPNYFPNSFGGPVEDPSVRSPAFQASGDVDRWNSEDEDNFTQAGNFYREVLGEEEKDRLVQNLFNSLKTVQKFIQEKAVKNFEQADAELGTKVRERLNQLP